MNATIPAELGEFLGVDRGTACFTHGHIFQLLAEPTAPLQREELYWISRGSVPDAEHAASMRLSWIAGPIVWRDLVDPLEARRIALRNQLVADARAEALEPARPERAPEGPLSSWRQVAAAIGVDDSTIRAHRRRTRDDSKPFFSGADAARSWYEDLVGTPAPPPRASRGPRAPKQPKGDGPVDWKNVKL
jgi:hypothetical protein